MSFLKKLFGGSERSETQAGEMYEGYVITPSPMPDNGQYRLAAEIRKEIGGEMKSHQLIRADVFPSAEQAADAARAKARRLIDEQGERIFS